VSVAHGAISDDAHESCGIEVCEDRRTTYFDISPLLLGECPVFVHEHALGSHFGRDLGRNNVILGGVILGMERG
jgi:hypothetical protein